MIASGARSTPADRVRECGVYGEVCYGSGASSIMPVLADGAAGVARRLFGRKPDRRGRVAIDLDTPPAPISAAAIRP